MCPPRFLTGAGLPLPWAAPASLSPRAQLGSAGRGTQETKLFLQGKEAFSSLSVPVTPRVTKTAEPAFFWGHSPGSGMASGKDSRGAWCSSLGSGLSREAGVLRMAQSHLEFLRGQSGGRNTVCVYPESSLGGTLPRS